MTSIKNTRKPMKNQINTRTFTKNTRNPMKNKKTQGHSRQTKEII